MTTLDDVIAEVTAWDANRPRSQQVTLGASEVFGCRAEKLLKLTGVPKSDPRMSWQAVVGTAIHAMLEEASPPDVITEQRFQYRGVWCTLDRADMRRYNEAQKKLTDFKTKDDARKIMQVRTKGPTIQQQAQVQIGAAALIEAGHEVETVELLFLPRAGDLRCAYLWSDSFDRVLADAAADWVDEQNARAMWHDAKSAIGALDGLRDEDLYFCSHYCDYYSACRGAA